MLKKFVVSVLTCAIILPVSAGTAGPDDEDLGPRSKGTGLLQLQAVWKDQKLQLDPKGWDPKKYNRFMLSLQKYTGDAFVEHLNLQVGKGMNPTQYRTFVQVAWSKFRNDLNEGYRIHGMWSLFDSTARTNVQVLCPVGGKKDVSYRITNAQDAVLDIGTQTEFMAGMNRLWMSSLAQKLAQRYDDHANIVRLYASALDTAGKSQEYQTSLLHSTATDLAGLSEEFRNQGDTVDDSLWTYTCQLRGDVMNIVVNVPEKYIAPSPK